MANYKIIKGNLLTDEVHIKEYDTTGKRKRYCLSAKIKVPRIMFETEVMGWNFNLVVHKAMKKLLKEIRNKFKK